MQGSGGRVMTRNRAGGWLLLCLAALAAQAGCAVPQRPGLGRCTRLVEPETKTGYWLYLPEDYVRTNGQRPDNAPWPLVVSLHGLRPYDDANPQIRSWQQEADRYGLVVVAPELRTCDQLVMQIPLRDATKWYVKKDEKAILAVMDEVCRRTNADPTRVLLTCFSSGGYMAHYMLNRHPERFTALAAMGANFSEEVLDYAQIPKYRNHKIAVFFGENDFKLCREESLRAVEWYRRYRFDVDARQIAGLGHERRPQVASAFFARIIGAAPKTPPDLASLVMQDVEIGEPGRPVVSPRPAPLSPSPLFPRQPADSAGDRSTGSPSSVTERSREPATVAPAIEIPTRSPRPVAAQPPPATPRRPVRQPYSESVPEVAPPGDSKELPPGAIRIRGRRTGPAPMWIEMSIEIPPSLRGEASVLWLDNGQPIASGDVEARTVLWSPGRHDIQALVSIPGHGCVVYQETVNVLPAVSSQPANNF